MPQLPAKYHEEFATEIRQKTAQAVWVLAIIAAIIWPCSAWLDFVAYGDQPFLGTLVKLRFGFWALLVINLGVLSYVRRRHEQLFFRRCRFFAWLEITIATTFVTWAALVPGGAEEIYFAGLMLMLLALLVSMPWSVLEMSISCLVLIAGFDGTMLLLDDELQLAGFAIANYFFISVSFIGLFWTRSGHEMRIRTFLDRKKIEEAKARSDELLLNILPNEVADELKANGRVEVSSIESCSILFTDFIGFTKLSGRVTADKLVASLDQAFRCFDDIVKTHDIEKLKTIGDSYMCAGGVIHKQPDHLVRCVLAGLEMVHAIQTGLVRSADGEPWLMRIGVHSGPVVAGVIGKQKFAYDLWGDTVNTASRLESAAPSRGINMTTALYKRVERFFEGMDRGYIPVRGKGPLAMTRVTRLRPQYSRDESGLFPNELLDEHVAAWSTSQERDGTEDADNPDLGLAQLDSDMDGLGALRSLSELTPQDREVILQRARTVHFRPGRVLVEQGQGMKILLLLLSGQVGVRIRREGVTIELARLGPGEIVGEMSFVSWEPASATVVALDEEVTALRLDLNWMQGILDEHPQTAARIFHSLSLVLAQRVRESDARLFTLGARRTALREASAARSAVATREVPEALRRSLDRFRDRMRELEDGPDPAVVAEAASEFVDAAVVGAGADAERWPLVEPGIAATILRETFPYFMRSAVIERMYAKPLGAIFDHVSAEGVYLREPHGHGLGGPLLDAWFLDWEICASIRACMKQCAKLIVEAHGEYADSEGFHVALLSAAAAPLLFDAWGQLKSAQGLEFTCLDGNVDALSELGRQAERQGLGQRLHCVCEDVFEDSYGQVRLRLVPQHLIGLPVLFGAADDTAILRVLDEVYDNLAPGGIFAIGLLHPPITSRFFAEVILHLDLQHWSAERLRNIASQSAFSNSARDTITSAEGLWSVLTLRRD